MRLLLLLVLFVAAGCDVYSKPGAPVPETFQARFLDGAPLDASTLRGRPWVISLWVPA